MGKVKEAKESVADAMAEAYEVGYTEGLWSQDGVSTSSSKQIGGSHYADMVITPTEYILANNISWLEANAIKYISRHKAKNGKEDILKAIHYLELIIDKDYSKGDACQ